MTTKTHTTRITQPETVRVKLIRRALAAVSLAALSTPVAGASLNVPAQDLPGAIRNLADQSGAQIVFSPEIAAGHQSQPVAGEYETSQALNTMLGRTGLTFTRQGPDGIIVIHSNPQKVAMVVAQADTPPENRPAPKPVVQPPAGLEEIVVTARRTPEKLQTTPVAVSAFSAKTLEQRNITDIYATQFSAPNMSVTPLLWNSGAAVTVRGQVNVENQSNSDPAVGIYVDGVYVARSTGGLLDLVDVDRLEVLRGPQGTLFGRNTTGGALNVTSTMPTGDFEGYVRATAGNYSLKEVQGAVNLPISGEQVAFRLSFKHSEHDGYGRNLYRNIDLDDMNKDYVRGILRIAPDGAGWDLTLSADYADWESSGQIAPLIGIRPGSTATLLPVVAPVAPGDNLNNYLLPADFYASYAGGATPSRTEVWGGSATLNVDLGFGQLKSITALRGGSMRYATDNDGTPYIILGTEAYINQKYQFTEELQLSGKSGPVSWIGGLFYFDEKNHDGNPFVQNLAPVGPPPTVNDIQTRNRSYAGYLQGTYEITPALHATAGARYTVDKREAVLYNHRFNSTVCNLNTTDVPGICQASQEKTFKYASYTFDLDYEAMDGVFLYAKTSRASRAGGFNVRSITPPFSPETVTDYELGIKGDFFERRLRTNASVFYSRYSNVQKSVNIVDSFTKNTSSAIQNAAKATLKGFEFEITALPIPELELNATVGYLDPTYKTYIDPATNADLSNSPFTYLSKITYSFAGTYRIPLSFGQVTLHADYGFQGRRYFAANPGLDHFDSQKGFGLLNARVALALDDPRVELALWGKNLTKVKYDTYRLDFYPTALGAAIAFRGAPRTYGASLTYRF